MLASAAAGVLCLPVAEAMGLSVVWGMHQSSAGGLVEAAVTGAIIGLAQSLVLRAYLPSLTWWLWPIATALGLVLGIVAVAQSRPFFRPGDLHLVLGLASDGAIVGAAVGLCQTVLLWPHVRLAILWLPVTILAVAPFFPTISGLNIFISQMLTSSMGQGDALDVSGRITESLALLLYGLVTGVALALLLRKPSA
jgi:hypothetical protein